MQWLYATVNMIEEHNPYWEADVRSASQEIPRLLRNPEVNYRVHKSPLPAPNLSQMNPVHTIPT
jgi:hypothetical protein